MTKVFIGGSRRITRLDTDVKQRIDRIIEKRLPVIVGDANGADKAVQDYLRSKSYEQVEVFCSGDECRNNAGHWPVRRVPVSGKEKGFDFYATKDRAMADEASVGLMLWDRKSAGTLMNILRLIRQDKKVAVYVSPDRAFLEVKAESDWNAIVTGCPAELRRKIDRESASLSSRRIVFEQGDLFSGLPPSLAGHQRP
jgi:hypothetical protein